MKKVQAFEVVVHGVEHAQYFQGCGIAFTDFTDVATGCGDDAAEAFDDALDSLAQADWDVSSLEDKGPKAKDHETVQDIVNDGHAEVGDLDGDNELHFYVSVRVS